MTLIEFFSDVHVDNIAACLHLNPDKLILVGEVQKMEVSAGRYRKVLDRRGMNTQIALWDTYGKSFDQLCAAIEKLIQNEDACIMDLIGGNETVIMAVGAVLAGLDRTKRQSVHAMRFDHDLGRTVNCMDGDRSVHGKPVNLTVEELIILHGGDILPGGDQLPRDWDQRDMEKLWEVVSGAPREWNRTVSLLNEFEGQSESKMQIQLKVNAIRGKISGFSQKEATFRKLLNKLHRRGIIDDRSDENTLKYTYRSELLRYCTLKAGNVLEVKTLLEGKVVTEKGRPFFHDCRMGVSIDWDGVFHKSVEYVPETRNEIDVVLMHGCTPLFISCKNGNIEDEELYKLNTVASRFGGPYARKMLIATDLDRKSAASNRAFMQRAWDMDIFLVTDAAELSAAEWQDIFFKAVPGSPSEMK